MRMKERIAKSMLIVGVGVVVNIALAIVKMYVGLSSNSICIMVDATNCFFDIATAIITILAFFAILSFKPKKAMSGMGRLEYLASFVIAIVSVVVSGWFFVRSLNRISMPEPVWFGVKNCVLIVTAVPIKLALGLMYFFANKRLKSKAISALVLDSFLDMGITMVTVVSFAVSSRVDYAVDGILGMVISVIAICFGIKMVFDSVRTIVSGDGVDEVAQKVKGLANTFGAEVVNLTLHDYGFACKEGSMELQFESDTNEAERKEIAQVICQKASEEYGAKLRIYDAKALVCQWQGEQPKIQGEEVQEMVQDTDGQNDDFAQNGTCDDKIDQ